MPPRLLKTRPQAQVLRCCNCKQQVRHASLYKRPLRPYTFTQIVQLSDGSTYTQRTTSPLPVLRSTKDTRNTLLWQPTLASLQNIEKDDAGRLAAFRQKFGRGWDAGEQSEVESQMEGRQVGGSGKPADVRGSEGLQGEEGQEDDLTDLISMGGWSGGDSGAMQAEKKGVEREGRTVTVMRGGKLIKVPVMTTAQKKAAAAESKK